MVACSGADAERATTLARELVSRGATALLSFGLAAGLAEGLAAGTPLLPSNILLPDGSSCAVDLRWRDAILARAAELRLMDVPVACTACVLAMPTDKKTLAAHGAAAADMESHAVAETARRAGVPFLVLRTVADPWDATLPPLAIAGLGPDGALRSGRVALGLLREPRHLPALLRLARDSRAGLAALREVLRCLGSLDPP